MNILLIGNGFDLAHNLPTTYNHFLSFCQKARRIYTLDTQVSLYEYTKKQLQDWEVNEEIKLALKSAFDTRRCSKSYANGTVELQVETLNAALNELYGHIKDNVWIDYFLECNNEIGENWIDFELEISKVIQALDNARFQITCGGSIHGVEEKEQKILISILKASKGSLRMFYESLNKIDSFTEYLNKELEKLIRALEIYIVEFVTKVNVLHKNSDIEKIKPGYVLSFNYSDTYERVYGNGKQIEYDYIHGKADINKNILTSNLVLGIDEYLDDSLKDKELEFLTFKKFYQRIYKSTGNAYLKWIDEIKREYSEYLDKKGKLRHADIECPMHTLYIFGHSLDITDKDVLKLLICNDNVQTKIFYYRKNKDDKKNLGKLIKNLVLMIGQEELIRRTGGINRTIEFISQTIE